MIMRLVRWLDDNDKMAVLYHDGTMQTFSVSDKTANAALSEFLTKYRVPDALTSTDGEFWSTTPTDEAMAAWGKDEVETLGYVSQNLIYGDDADYALVMLDASVICNWMKTAPVGLQDITKADNKDYITLQEFCDKINEGKEEKDKVSIFALRTKITRNQISGAVKIGRVWYVPADATLPADRRRKEMK